MKQIKVLSEKCIACGKCYLNFPDVFDCDDEGIAFVKKEANPSQELASKNAIYDCPTRAILWQDIMPQEKTNIQDN